DRSDTVLGTDFQRASIARCELLTLAARSTVPDRSYGVDDVSRRQLEPRRQLRIASVAAAQFPAGCQQLRSCGTVDRAIDAAAAQQSGVGSVHDRIDRELSDVRLDCSEDHDTTLASFNALKHTSIAQMTPQKWRAPISRTVLAHGLLTLRYEPSFTK